MLLPVAFDVMIGDVWRWYNVLLKETVYMKIATLEFKFSKLYVEWNTKRVILV
jgi:hypothetical protein